MPFSTLVADHFDHRIFVMATIPWERTPAYLAACNNVMVPGGPTQYGNLSSLFIYVGSDYASYTTTQRKLKK